MEFIIDFNIGYFNSNFLICLKIINNFNFIILNSSIIIKVKIINLVVTDSCSFDFN